MIFAKRYLGLIALLLSPGFLQAQSATLNISLPRLEAPAGLEVGVIVTAKDASSLGALHLELRYDPAVLEFRSVSQGSLLAGNTMIDSTNSPGRLVVGVVSLDPVQGDGPLANAKFMVKGNEGATTSLRLEALRAWDNKSHAELLVANQDGELKVVSAGSGTPPATSQYLPWIIAGGAILLLLLVVVRRQNASRQ